MFNIDQPLEGNNLMWTHIKRDPHGLLFTWDPLEIFMWDPHGILFTWDPHGLLFKWDPHELLFTWSPHLLLLPIEI